MFFKDFQTKLSKKNRHYIKWTVMLYASDVLKWCRIIMSKISLDVNENTILDDMEYLRKTAVKNFTKRCNDTIALSQDKSRYAKRIIKKHILPIMGYVFSTFENKLNKLDTIELLGGRQCPRFYYSNKIRASRESWGHIRREIFHITYI